MTSHNHQKKAAVINDFSGFGRCSLTTAIPILSAMRIQCCPLPTAIFSNHTGYPSYYWTDFTEHMKPYMEEWRKLELHFNAIQTGFLGSIAQIDCIKSFLQTFQDKDTIVVIDPVMGDYGKLYPTYSRELAEAMRALTEHATILTPNLTEACILTGVPYQDCFSEKILEQMCEQLSAQGAEKIVITSIQLGETELGNFVYERGKPARLLRTRKILPCRSGTGDVFSAILTGDAIHGVDFTTSVQHASAFIAKTIERTIAMQIPETDGICFEEYLYELGNEVH